MKKRSGKFFKRLVITLGIVLLLLFIFRGIIYQKLIRYVDLDARKSYVITNDSLVTYIDNQLSDKNFSNIHEIADFSQSITSEILSFSLESKVSDPNVLWETRKANCVGYATLTAAVMNYILNKKNDQDWKAEPRRGLLFCGGFNLNKLFHNKYFKDHDFVLIRHTESGAEIYIDSSVHDYLGVNEVEKYQSD